MEAGLEYNDETYDIQNWTLQNKTGYTDVEEAKAEAFRRVKEIAKGFNLGDLGWDWGYDIESKYILSNWPEAQSDHWGYTYGEWIEYAEENDIDWKPGIPQLVTVQKIEY